MQSEISIWLHVTQLNIQKRLLFVLASPPTKDNTDASHRSPVIQAKIWRQNATRLNLIKMLNDVLDKPKIPHTVTVTLVSLY